jgi:hypothetical protein
MFETYHLLMNIPTNYNVISCYNHVLWGFSIDPPFCYNPAEQENPVLHIFYFGDLSGLKLTWEISGVNILPREAPGGEEVNETRLGGQMGTGGTGPQPGHATRLGLEPPLSSIFVSRCSADLKSLYKDPLDDHDEEAAEKHKTQKHRLLQ